MSHPVRTRTYNESRPRRQDDDRGSLTVEIIVLTPVILLIALTVLIFGRVTQSRQQVVEAARAGAEAAAVMPNAADAQWGSEVDAAVGAADSGHRCVRQQVDTDVSHFVPGGFVTVTVICQVALSDLSVPGFPGATTVRASATAPIDPFRSVG